MVAEVFERYFGLTGWCTVIWILHEGTGRDCSVVSDFVLWFNLYTPKRVQGRRLEFSNVVMANIVGFLLIFTVLYNLQSYVDQFRNFSREMFFYFFAINTVLEESFRLLIRQFLRTIRKNGYNLKHVLLVGYSRAAEQYIDRIQQNPQWGYNVRGILDDNIARGTTYKGVKVIGSVGNLLYILPENKLDEIAITLGLEEYYKLEKIVSECEKSGVHTKFIPDYGNIIPTKPYTEDLLGLPVINIRYVPLSNTFNALVKRCMDIVGSLICIVLFSPIMLLTAIAVKVTSKGPLIFKQERVDCIMNHSACISSAPCMCRLRKKNAKAGHIKMIRGSQRLADFCARRALMSFPSCLTC